MTQLQLRAFDHDTKRWRWIDADSLGGGGGSGEPQTFEEVLETGGDPGGNPITGGLLIQPTAGEIIEALLTVIPATQTDIFGNAAAVLGLGSKVVALGSQSGDNANAVFEAVQGVVKTPATGVRSGLAIGGDFGVIFQGQKALAGATQMNELIGVRGVAMDYDYTAAGDDATGTVIGLVGIEPYVTHSGKNTVASLVGVAAFVEASQNLGVTPGPITNRMIGVSSFLNTDDSFGTLPIMYGYLAERSNWANTPVTLAAGMYIKNFGLAGTVDSYGLYIAEQSGSDNPYGIFVSGGKNVLKAASGQTDPLLELQDHSGIPLLIINADGAIFRGDSVDEQIAHVLDAQVSVPVVSSLPDIIGSSIIKQGQGMRIQAFAPNQSGDDTLAYYVGAAIALRGPAGTQQHGGLIGIDALAVFRNTHADSSTTQGGVNGGRFTGSDITYDVGGDAATGRIQGLQGLEAYAQHASAARVNTLSGLHAYAIADQLVTPVPGPIGVKIAAIIAETNPYHVTGTIPNVYGIDILTTIGVSPITRVAGIRVQDHGGAGVVTSYGILIEAQTGSDNIYGLYVAGGKSVFADHLIIGKSTAPADADLANSQGAWYVDPSTGGPKWKAKTSGGTVVARTPVSNDSGVVMMPGLPTSDPHVVDQLWNSAGTLKVSAG